MHADAPQRIYNTLVMLSLLECAIDPACNWAKEVKAFIAANSSINLPVNTNVIIITEASK